MKIQVILHSILRDKLPPQAHGRTVLEMPEGSCLDDVLTRLGIQPPVACAINGSIERDLSRVLQDGVEVRFFRVSGGGSVQSDS